MTATETPNPRCHWFQFRLRSLFVLAAVCALPCGWLSWKIEHKRTERQEVAVLKELGGVVLYDWQYENDKGTPPGPLWLRSLYGDDFFAEVASVFFSPNIERRVTNEDLAHLDTLTHLRTFGFFSDEVTDAGLVRLQQMAMLERLTLYGNQITDVSLANIRGTNHLTYLELWCDCITDTGVRSLGRNTALETVLLSSTHITDEGLSYLGGLKALHHLTLFNSRVSAAGIKDLRSALPNCDVNAVNTR